jgi:hypothetical protein
MPQNNATEQIAQLLNVEFPPPLDPSAIKSLQKARPGYQTVSAKTTPMPSGWTALKQGLADVTRLEPVEHLLEKLYLSERAVLMYFFDRCGKYFRHEGEMSQIFQSCFPPIR